MKWYKSESGTYPIEIDTESSKVYNYVRKNIETKTETIEGESVNMYVYDECKIKKEDWDIYQDIMKITPTEYKKTAYIGDTETIFSGVKEGNLSVFAKDTEGRYPACTAERSGDTVRVSFEPLENVTEITLSIS